MNPIIILSIIAIIESGSDPNAINLSTGATGLYQITYPCLTDYNRMNNTDYEKEDMYQPVYAEKVADWYLNERIPQILKAYQIPDTVDNRLKAYNWGIGNLVSAIKYDKPIPKETKEYIKKYHQLERERYGRKNKSV